MSFCKSMLRAFAAFFAVCVVSGMHSTAKAQTDNLMLVKYVDWDSGSGVAVLIWNPTANAVNLANYQVRIYGNGSTTPTTTSNLNGLLQPCGTILVSNDDYRNTNCRNTVNSANFDAFSPGVNGNDVVALTYTSALSPLPTAPFQLIDAIGRIGFDPGNNNSQKVGNTNDALYQHKIERTAGNLARYSLFGGTYSPNITNAANIWPGNSTTSVQGWTVSNASCLTNTWTSAGGITVSAGPDRTFACKTTVPIALTGASATPGAALLWTGGKGTFSNSTSLSTTYTPHPQDPYRIVLTLSAAGGCGQVTDELVILNGDSTVQPKALLYTPQAPETGDTVVFQIETQAPNKPIVSKFDYGDGSLVETRRSVGRHVYTQPGTYQVRVWAFNILGCPLDSLLQQIVIAKKPVVVPEVPVTVIIPNIFTPNNDGLNDTYKPQLPATTSYKLEVYNRWGIRIFESEFPERVWDGKNTADGVYFVHLKAMFRNGEVLERKLPVTIVR
jgi:hypothetical protein